MDRLLQPLIAQIPRATAAGLALAVLLASLGCSGSSAKVTGRVTCQGKPVVGGITFSPKGEGASNTGAAVNAGLTTEGRYELRLTTVGKHTVVVTPRDVKIPTKPGELDYPCDRAPKEVDVKAGDNDIVIELTPREP